MNIVRKNKSPETVLFHTMKYSSVFSVKENGPVCIKMPEFEGRWNAYCPKTATFKSVPPGEAVIPHDADLIVHV